MTTNGASGLHSTQQIKQLAAGQTFKGIFIVTSCFRKTDRNGRPYWEMGVSDACGTLEAKIWTDAGWWNRSGAAAERPVPIDVEDAAALLSLVGKTMGIAGKTNDFRGQVQYNFNSLTLLDQEKYPPSDYVRRSPVDAGELAARFEALVDACGSGVRDFLRFVFEGQRWTRFKDWPAAVSHHHAYAGGLLEHTVCVAESARAIAQNYREPQMGVDMDIVIAGALLHDIGKLDAYTAFPVPEVTVEGAVLEHVSLGYAAFMKMVEEYGFDRELATQIAHILLSHHGRKEYGSPVLPATPEALIVSAADELDFHLFCWQDAVKDLVGDQAISQHHFSAQRRFWNRSNP